MDTSCSFLPFSHYLLQVVLYSSSHLNWIQGLDFCCCIHLIRSCSVATPKKFVSAMNTQAINVDDCFDCAEHKVSGFCPLKTPFYRSLNGISSYRNEKFIRAGVGIKPRSISVLMTATDLDESVSEDRKPVCPLSVVLPFHSSAYPQQRKSSGPRQSQLLPWR